MRGDVLRRGAVMVAVPAVRGAEGKLCEDWGGTGSIEWGGEEMEEELVKAETLRELLHEQQAVFKGLMLAAQTQIQVHRSENSDSIEIGSQKEGRIKIYGDFTKKTEFAQKIKDAVEVLLAAQSAMPKVQNGE